ncbi:MAG TPA: acyl carrier protein [Candidatus Stackebrandtia excrementipullorum]|nr:acyl carrier protein [Candidatus Stackebrandtia excrementipullorum]
MDETRFKKALEEFTTKSADEMTMSDDLVEIGMDSIGVFEFVMKVEDEIGQRGVEIDESIASVQDLYDRVLDVVD